MIFGIFILKQSAYDLIMALREENVHFADFLTQDSTYSIKSLILYLLLEARNATV